MLVPPPRTCQRGKAPDPISQPPGQPVRDQSQRPLEGKASSVHPTASFPSRFLHFNLICGSEALVIQAPDQAPRTLCGSHAPEPLQFQGGNVSLIYRREWVSEEGFQLKYERGHRCPQGMPPPCPPSCNLSLGDFYGVFSSPAFSLGALPGAAHCQWALDPHDSRPLTVRFTALDLGPGDSLLVYEGVPGAPAHRHLLRSLGDTSNGRTVSVDSPSSRAWVLYQAALGTGGRGFNATYHVRGYCVPWELPCGAGDGEGPRCYGEAERCDGTWDCADGADEEGCNGCGPGCYSCGGGHAGVGGASCYSAADRCNYQTFCADAADERRCQVCQPGNFLCRDGRCIYESWVCDGQADCADASDEESCAYTLPRKVVTAAVIGSLVCGLLLVIALGCTCRLYALRTHHYGILAPLSRMEAQMVQRQAPPSYGQLIARGVIPPVEDFPTESPSQVRAYPASCSSP
uniref:LDL receptor related protein 10 n=1 Tax=Sphenodon punctatus TaxID=8508 RepID=A0A8D0G618_SPHPU